MTHLDILMERLRGYDEVTVLELLDITTAELLERFKDIVYNKRSYLSREVELLEPDEEVEDEFDGFQVEFIPDFDDE